MATISNYISSGKDLLTLCRDLLIFILVLLLLFFPTVLKQRLVKAGIREGEFMGMKWKAEDIEKTNLSLNESQVTISNLKKQLDSTTQLLAVAQTKISDPAFKQQASKLEAKNETALNNASATQVLVKRTIASTLPMVRSAQEMMNTTNEWGVVYGGDASLQSAQYEVGPVARKFEIPNAGIYHRQGIYRSVAVVNDRDKADDVLAKAKRRRADAYIVSMSTWCPDAESADGYKECPTR